MCNGRFVFLVLFKQGAEIETLANFIFLICQLFIPEIEWQTTDGRTLIITEPEFNEGLQGLKIICQNSEHTHTFALHLAVKKHILRVVEKSYSSLRCTIFYHGTNIETKILNICWETKTTYIGVLNTDYVKSLTDLR
jgi:hypothetical protein